VAPAVEPLPPALEGDERDVTRERQRLLERYPQPLLDAGPDHDLVHDHVDAVVAAGIERGRLVRPGRAAVDPRAEQPLPRELGQLLPPRPLAAADDGGEDRQRRARGVAHQPFRDLVRGLRHDRLGAPRAVGLPEGPEEDAQVIVDLGHGSDGRAGMADGRALLDGDRGR
jgi:hypothetical protein